MNTDTKAREMLLPLWMAEQILSHSPQENDLGYTCDELGCAICNAGDELIEWIVEADRRPSRDQPSWMQPSMEEIIEGVESYLERVKEGELS